MSTCRGDGVLLVATRAREGVAVGPSATQAAYSKQSDANNFGPLDRSGYGTGVLVVVVVVGRVVPLHM